MSGPVATCIAPFPATLGGEAGRCQLVADVGWRPLAYTSARRADPAPLASDAATLHDGVRLAHAAPPTHPAHAPAAADTRTGTPRTTPAPGHVLLVEDDRDFAALLCTQLRNALDIRWVAGTDAAVRALLLHPVDLVLSAVELRGDGGLALCRRIRRTARLAHLPVLLMSATATRDGRTEATLSGASDYFVKPFDIDVLHRAIALALAKHTRNPQWGALAGAPGHTNVLDHAFAGIADPAFGVREWAERVHLSERQLRRRVIAGTGLAPLAWLREQRLVNVQRLLDDGTCNSLHEAGGRVGLVNGSYLRRLYRARFAAAASG